MPVEAAEIADPAGELLGTSEQMIKNKLRVVYDATGMSSRLELALFVLKHPMLRQAADEALRSRINSA